MSRHVRDRLVDVEAAIQAIETHLSRGDLSDGLVFDAVRVRLIETGEAVKAIPREPSCRRSPTYRGRRSPG